MTIAQIDPLEPLVDGIYRDDLVEVAAQHGPTPRRELHTVRTPHFDLTPAGPRVLVTHRVRPEEIDDDLSALLAAELFRPGWLRGAELFEHLFTGVVLTSDPDPLAGWERFYRNTLDRVRQALGTSAARGAHGAIADYAPVYAHAERQLAPGSVLELGSCFGFLALRLAEAGREVMASDVSAGAVELLATIAPRLGITLTARVADAARVPLPDRSADNVLAVHLLEHLDPDVGDRVVAEALRLARRRVVVAVPLEDVADETWGHVRTVSLADLTAWGEASGLPYRVLQHHGGWLVIDVSQPLATRRERRPPALVTQDPAPPHPPPFGGTT